MSLLSFTLLKAHKYVYMRVLACNDIQPNIKTRCCCQEKEEEKKKGSHAKITHRIRREKVITPNFPFPPRAKFARNKLPFPPVGVPWLSVRQGRRRRDPICTTIKNQRPSLCQEKLPLRKFIRCISNT